MAARFAEEFAAHRAHGGELTESHHHGGNILSIEQRGEYVYTATGAGGFRVYDVANVANKNFSERIVTAHEELAARGLRVGWRNEHRVILLTKIRPGGL